MSQTNDLEMKDCHSSVFFSLLSLRDLVKMETKAGVRPPSPNKRRKAFGIVKAAMKASAKTVVPKKCLRIWFLTSPNRRESMVKKAIVRVASPIARFSDIETLNFRMAKLTECSLKAYLRAMANHKSAAKRARQSIKRKDRNYEVRSKIRNAEKAVRQAAEKKEDASKVLSQAFKVIQKARGVLHQNSIKRKMARLSKVASQSVKKAS